MIELSRRALLKMAAATPLASLFHAAESTIQYHGALDIGMFVKAPWRAVGMDLEHRQRADSD